VKIIWRAPRIRAAFGKSAAAPSLRFDRDAGRAAHDLLRIAELDADAVGLGQERHTAAGRRENREGRRRVAVDRRREARADRREALAALGLVWQRLMASGKVAEPVFAVAVIKGARPTLTVATAKAFEPVVPVMCRMPSFCAVATSATISGTDVVDADSNKVLRPVLLGAALTPLQSKPSITIVGANGTLKVNAMTKLCEAPAAIDAGVFGEPVSALVAGLVVWYIELADTVSPVRSHSRSRPRSRC
jgi:hypothetical protein